MARWSPRAFRRSPVSAAQLQSCFEAARWAPSCFNEQPWLFVFGQEEADHARMLDLLVPGNQVWAQHAPVLGFVLSKQKFGRNDKPNGWADFDCGAAAMSMTLQAEKLGLRTHFMGGFDADRAYAALGVDPAEWRIVAAFALGPQGDAGDLPEELREREAPSGRKPLAEVCCEGRLGS